MGEGKSGSTLGTSSGRTSNIEANEYLRSRKEERQTKKTETENAEDITSNEPPAVESIESSASNPPSNSPIYEWRDEDGNLHMTNELGKVPPEYQDQFFEERQGVPRQ